MRFRKEGRKGRKGGREEGEGKGSGNSDGLGWQRGVGRITDEYDQDTLFGCRK